MPFYHLRKSRRTGSIPLSLNPDQAQLMILFGIVIKGLSHFQTPQQKKVTSCAHHKALPGNYADALKIGRCGLLFFWWLAGYVTVHVFTIWVRKLFETLKNKIFFQFNGHTTKNFGSSHLYNSFDTIGVQIGKFLSYSDYVWNGKMTEMSNSFEILKSHCASNNWPIRT